MRRRRALAWLGSGAAGLAGATAGCIRARTSETPLTLSSPAFDDEGTLPTRYTCEGAGVSPPLTVESVPGPAAALAVRGEADLGVFSQPIFWLVWNLPPDTDRLPEGVPRTGTLDALGGARQSTAPDGRPGYDPPCPPRGRTTTYRFDLVALEEPVDAEPGAPTEATAEAVERALVARDRVTATYTRPPAGATEEG